MAQQNKYPLTTARLQLWINVRIRRMQQKLAQEGSNNSGALRQSLAANFNDSVDEKGGIISGLIIAKDYWAFVDEGVRGVGGNSDITNNAMPNQNATSPFKYDNKKPPLSWGADGVPRGPIGEWVRTKVKAGGNDLFTALNVRESIFRKGTKPTYFASDVLTEQAINELNEEIAETLLQDIANQFEE